MRNRLCTLATICLLLCSQAWASKLFIPMDATAQKNHLKAYGIAFAAMQQGIKVDWLLNYRGGSFATDYNKNLQQLCNERGVTCEKMTDKQYNAVIRQISDPASSARVVQLEKAPKIAVYTPPNQEPWDDAVTLALTYAEIPFDKIYAGDVLAGDLSKYDWLHLHHEDFTGQYGKFWAQFHNVAWYKNDQAAMEALAAKNGFKKVSQMQLAVVKKIKEFVANGGNLFAMCSATETFDIALAADGVDICDEVFDGDPMDSDAQHKLDFSKCLAFKDFTISWMPNVYMHSNIDNTNFRKVATTAALGDYNEIKYSYNDYFTIYPANAKFDPILAMLTQNHTTTIKGFMGQTTAFRKEVLKPGVEILGDCAAQNEARYIHGELGKGSWTFLGGHDPEDYQHLVGDPPTDLSQHPNSPGYRLILNNVLFPSVKAAPVPVLNFPQPTPDMPYSVPDVTAQKSIKMYPNPATNELLITLTPGNITEVAIDNFAGQEVLRQSFGAPQASVSMAHLAPGMYLIKVNGEFAGKVVKE